jgi:hypothetical protein
LRGEARDEVQQTGFAAGELVQDDLTFVGFHCGWMIFLRRSFGGKRLSFGPLI